MREDQYAAIAGPPGGIPDEVREFDTEDERHNWLVKAYQLTEEQARELREDGRIIIKRKQAKRAGMLK